MIVAELSANHNQDISVAIKSIAAAKKAGADAIKLQTYTPDTLTINCDDPVFRISGGTLWDGMNLYELYKKAYTPWEWHEALFNKAKEEGILCFSSPFDFSAVDFLEKFDPPAYKIASFEITDIPLIKYVASKKRPVIISTGIANEGDIQMALDACHDQGNFDVMLLKCTSGYPAPVEEANLLTLTDINQHFGCPYGISDHTTGIAVSVAAVAFGARLIEKHFILDRALGGPDADFSLNPDEFRQLVDAARTVEKAIGVITYEPTPTAVKGKKFSRSLFAVKNISVGEQFSPENVRSIRPGDGLHPKYFEWLMGKKATRNIKRGTPLYKDLIK